jgi:hypothetical protein
MMSRGRSRARRTAIGLACAWALAACQHNPTIVYPESVEAGTTEAGFDCPRLDDAILKADAVRWVMREDGARLLSPLERDARVAGDVALMAASVFACFICPPIPLFGDDGDAVLDRADRRLLSLLRIKAQNGCPGQPTSFGSMNDLELYRAVATLVAEEAGKDAATDVAAIRAERMRLLDLLRPPAAGP